MPFLKESTQQMADLLLDPRYLRQNPTWGKGGQEESEEEFKGGPLKGEVLGLEVRENRAGGRDFGVTEAIKVP